MKYVFVFIILLFSFLSCTAQLKDSTGILFEEPVYHFGIIKKSSFAEHTFVFVNRSKTPLLILNVISYCGCIETTWTKQPLVPSDSGLINVKYNAYATGTFSKTVKVFTNHTSEPISLTIKGECR